MTAHSKDEGLREAKLLVSVAEIYAGRQRDCAMSPTEKNRRRREVAWSAYYEQAVICGEQIARALLSSSAAERGMREMLGKMIEEFDDSTYDMNGGSQSPSRKQLIADAKEVHAALSARAGEEEQEQATRADDGPTAPTDRL